MKLTYHKNNYYTKYVCAVPDKICGWNGTHSVPPPRPVFGINYRYYSMSQDSLPMFV